MSTTDELWALVTDMWAAMHEADEVQARLDAEAEWAESDEGSMASCRHAGACRRMARRAEMPVWCDERTTDAAALATAMGCSACDEWEGRG